MDIKHTGVHILDYTYQPFYILDIRHLLNQVINEILWQNVMDSGYPAKIWIKLVKLEIGIS